MSDRINYDFNAKIKATGNKVVLQKLERKRDIIKNGVLIPEEFIAGYTVTKAKVLSVGPDAKFENFKEGDTVLYDTCAVFYDTHPVVIVKVENIICIVEDEENE